MKILKKSFVRRMRFLTCAVALLSLIGLVVQSQAQSYVLSSGNSTAAIDIGSGPGGMSDWVVDGVDQLNRQWFYYRVGSSGQEYPVENIGTPTPSNPAANRLDVTYANASYSVMLSYTLNGNTLGSGKSGLNEAITVKNLNLTGPALAFHFYQYSDFDLAGVPGNQSVKMTATLPSNAFSVVQTNSGTGVGFTESATCVGVPYLLEAGLYDLTLASLTDTSPTILNGILTAGTGNVTFASEWDMTINANGTKQISKLTTIVPEPSSMTLILSGIVALGLMQRRGRAR